MNNIGLNTFCDNVKKFKNSSLFFFFAKKWTVFDKMEKFY